MKWLPLCARALWLGLCAAATVSGGRIGKSLSHGFHPRIMSPGRLRVQAAAGEGKQVLSLVEPQTQRKVLLVGTMHYNPASIAKSENVIKELASENKLSTVVIEMCDKRFKGMETNQPRGSNKRKLLNNEMQAAADVARDKNINVVLGDAKIANILDGAKAMALKTLRDLVTIDGWKSIGADLKTILDSKSNTGQNPQLGPQDFLDPWLLLGTPISLIRYPLAFYLKNPLKFTAFFAALQLLAVSTEVGAAQSVEAASSILTIMTIFNFVFFIISARVLAIVFLLERDVTLADSIREACKTAGSDQTVVAILGMAHCNGVARLLSNTEKELGQ